MVLLLAGKQCLMIRLCSFILAIFLLSACTLGHITSSLKKTCSRPQVLVTGYAQAFVGDTPVSNANIKILETGETTTTDAQGHFAFCSLPQQRITLELSKQSFFFWNNYQTTQSMTGIVPPQGITTPPEQITLQVPRQYTFAVLKKLLSDKHHLTLEKDRCNVAATITAFNKTLADDPQGEPGAKVLLWHNHKLINNPPAIYFGIFHKKTNPWQTMLTTTSEDGGVILYNLTPSEQLYSMSAIKTGKKISTVNFWCRPGAFINLSPPYGPRVLQ